MVSTYFTSATWYTVVTINSGCCISSCSSLVVLKIRFVNPTLLCVVKSWQDPLSHTVMLDRLVHTVQRVGWDGGTEDVPSHSFHAYCVLHHYHWAHARGGPYCLVAPTSNQLADQALVFELLPLKLQRIRIQCELWCFVPHLCHRRLLFTHVNCATALPAMGASTVKSLHRLYNGVCAHDSVSAVVAHAAMAQKLLSRASSTNCTGVLAPLLLTIISCIRAAVA